MKISIFFLSVREREREADREGERERRIEYIVNLVGSRYVSATCWHDPFG